MEINKNDLQYLLRKNYFICLKEELFLQAHFRDG